MNDMSLPLCSALFQASVFLEAAYCIGTQERQIGEICAQAATAVDELERENEQLKRATVTKDESPMHLVDQELRDSAILGR
jgi:hypothetical protein